MEEIKENIYRVDVPRLISEKFPDKYCVIFQGVFDIYVVVFDEFEQARMFVINEVPDGVIYYNGKFCELNG